MAKCPYCKREMLTADGCSVKEVLVDGEKYHRIKVGEPGDFYEDEGNPNLRCGDCGAKFGHYHHVGCDIERNPKYGSQFLEDLWSGDIQLLKKDRIPEKNY